MPSERAFQELQNDLHSIKIGPSYQNHNQNYVQTLVECQALIAYSSISIFLDPIALIYPEVNG